MAFFALCAALGAVGVTSWRRTRGIRRGSPRGWAPPAAVSGRTSRLTWLAALAGAAGAAWGAVADGIGPTRLGLLAGGGFVAIAGSRSRIRQIAADQTGLTVRAARGPPFFLAWGDLSSLRPPRVPVGGWRFQGRSGSTTLMPSDLWGIERVLQFAIAAAGLRFDGRGWVAGT
jgi:hypothetical protein